MGKSVSHTKSDQSFVVLNTESLVNFLLKLWSLNISLRKMTNKIAFPGFKFESFSGTIGMPLMIQAKSLLMVSRSKGFIANLLASSLLEEFF
jgi:hypothetical protein